MMKYTREDIHAVYDEVNRRVQCDINDGYLTDEEGYIPAEAIKEYRKTILQGVYATFMMLSDDWPFVRQMCLEEGENRGWIDWIMI